MGLVVGCMRVCYVCIQWMVYCVSYVYVCVMWLVVYISCVELWGILWECLMCMYECYLLVGWWYVLGYLYWVWCMLFINLVGLCIQFIMVQYDRRIMYCVDM